MPRSRRSNSLNRLEEELTGVDVDNLDPVEEHRLRRRVREIQAQKKDLLDQLTALQDKLSIVEEAQRHRIPPIKPRERKSGLREGTAVVLASDWHVEEEVLPEKVQHRNAYNLEISRRRATRFFEGVKWFVEAQRQTFKVRDLVLWLGGDMITNHLHEDNAETNLLGPPQAFAYARKLISDGIRFLLLDKELATIHIPCNDGNHGRLTKDLRAATRMEHSLEWLLYATLAEEFRQEPRVKFEIAVGDHLYTQIYNMTIRWTHGAEIRYGGGVGGITIPLYNSLRNWETVRRADLTVLGHFHQLHNLSDFVVNGSLIGYSPYALRIRARFESPQQAAFMIDPKRGKSVFAPLWVADREGD